MIRNPNPLIVRCSMLCVRVIFAPTPRRIVGLLADRQTFFEKLHSEFCPCI